MKIETFVRDMNHWLELNGPNAVAKLSSGANVSTSTINKVRKGYCPRLSKLRDLCEHMGLRTEAYIDKGTRRAG